METQLLDLFVEVAKQGSFAEAARQKDLDPSSVSRAIATLEASVSLRLFQRSTRKLTLTEAGAHYLQRIKPLLAELAFANEEAQQLSKAPSGLLRMTASVAFGQWCLLPHIKNFQERFPNIKVELYLTDANLDLFSDNIDLACRLAPALDSNLIGVRLFETRYRICVSPEYHSTTPSLEQPEDLLHHQCVTFNLPNYRSKWLFKNSQARVQEIKIESKLAISSALALRTCALQGLGPVLLADWLVDKDIAAGRLVHVLQDYAVTATDFETAAWLLYPSRQFLPAKTRVMIDFLKEKLRK